LLLVDADVVLTTVATIVTSFRLCIRARQKRLWIDDAWAALGMIFNSSLLVAVCLYTQDYSEHLHGVYVAYIVLKKRRDISSRHKDSIILHVCSLSSYTVTWDTLQIPYQAGPIFLCSCMVRY
jgi:hypothetical protein